MGLWWVDFIDGDILTLGLEMVEAWGRGVPLVPRAWDRIGGSNHGTKDDSQSTLLLHSARISVCLLGWLGWLIWLVGAERAEEWHTFDR